jgi:hypothetical protein
MTEKRWVMSPRKRKAFMAAAAAGGGPAAVARVYWELQMRRGNGREEPRWGEASNGREGKVVIPVRRGGAQWSVAVGRENQVAEKEDVSGREWGPRGSEGEAVARLPRGLRGRPRGATPRVCWSICFLFPNSS